MVYPAVTLVCMSVLTLVSGQASTNQNVCSTRFESELAPQCFEAYGVNFTGVIYVLSANRSGGIPPEYTYESFVKFLCK